MTHHECNGYQVHGKIIMAIKNLIQDKTTMLVVSPADLKEFALAIVEEMKNTPMMDEHLYTPKEFAKRHDVDVSTLWRWRKIGILHPTKVGGKLWYKDSDLTRRDA